MLGGEGVTLEGDAEVIRYRQTGMLVLGFVGKGKRNTVLGRSWKRTARQIDLC